jgi:hypothetical protein
MAEQSVPNDLAGKPSPVRLRDALRKARIEAADRTGVVVDLRDAEVARLEISMKRSTLFAEIPLASICSIAALAGRHAAALDRLGGACVDGPRQADLSLTQDTRFGRILIAESHDVPVMVDAVTTISRAA